MLSKNEIITQVYNCDEVKEVLTKVPADIRDDLKQHVFLEMLIKDDDDIQKLHNDGKINHYVAKTIWNLQGYKEDKFHRVQRKQTEFPSDFTEQAFQGIEEKSRANNTSPGEWALIKLSIDSIINEQGEEQEQTAIEACKNALNELHFYHKFLLEKYLELGSYQAVSDFIAANPNTGGQTIAPRSICNAVHEARRIIKEGIQWRL